MTTNSSAEHPSSFMKGSGCISFSSFDFQSVICNNRSFYLVGRFFLFLVGLLVFEDCEDDETRPPTTTAKDLPPSTVDELAQVIPNFAKLLNEDTMVYVIGMLLEDPYDDDTRETVREILMEALSSHCDCDGVDGEALCDGLFMLIDPDQQQEQQQQRDTISSNNPPIVISTNTKTRPPKTSTPMNTNTNTNNNKKKQKKTLPPKTQTPREKIVEEWTQLRSTIAELTDEDTEGYVSGTLWRILLMKIHESLFVEY